MLVNSMLLILEILEPIAGIPANETASAGIPAPDQLDNTKDGSFVERPEQADIIMNQNDLKIYKKLNEKNIDKRGEAVKAMERDATLQAQRDKIAKLLKTEDVYKVTSSEFWRKIYNYIVENLEKLMENGYFSIPFLMRYSFCAHIVVFIPQEAAFVFPGFYKIFIPKQAYKIKILKDALEELDRFLEFIKKKSKNELLITVFFGRSGNPKEDLAFILEIPNYIRTDPIKILRWILKFEFKANGYNNQQEETNTVTELAKHIAS